MADRNDIIRMPKFLDDISVTRKMDTQISTFRAAQCTVYPNPLNSILGFPQTCRIKKRHWQPVQIKLKFNHISCRSLPIRYDRHISLGQPVQETRFSGIWRSDDSDFKPHPDPFGRRKSCQLALQRFAQFGDCFENPIGDLIRNVFVREINTDLDQSASFDQKLPPFQRLLGQLAARGAQGQLTLSLRLCCKEITEPLDFGKIHPAVQKGSPCELTGFRWSGTHGQQR